MHAQPDPLSTNVLLALARDGDERAFRQLYERYLARLRQWAHGRLSDRARDVLDTDVLSHQVLTNVFLQIPALRLEHERCFKAYVSQALRNAVISANRGTGPDRVDVESLAETLADSDPTPLERVIYRDTERALIRAFNQLDPRYQRVIVLRRVEGRSHRQVAEAMDFSTEDAARVACSRAYERLQENMRAIVDPPTAA